MWDPIEIRRRAERLFGENRVPTGKQLELIAAFSEDEQEAAQAAAQQRVEVTAHGYVNKSAEGTSVAAMSAEQVALIPRCAECAAHWMPADEKPWSAYLGGLDVKEPAEVVFYCPECAQREFSE
jgi:hypothetical protein